MSRASVARDTAAEPGPGLAGVPRSPVGLRVAAATHPGLVRDRNEDRVHVDPERGILLVVDGIGGEAGGEQAAETALELVRRRLERRTGTPEERLREAIAVANNEIVSLAARHPSWTGMGCVLTAALVEDDQVTVGHVGDSRLYSLRNGSLVKVTHDHSPVGEREDRGELGEREAMSHPRRNEVYRSVGAEVHAPGDRDFVEISRFTLAHDDALMLCSDGLTDLVASDEIARIVEAEAAEPERVVERLVDAALAAGGKDNVSVVFATTPRPFPGGRDGRGHAAGALAASDRIRAFLTRRWVQFALGALAGAAIAIGLSRLGEGRRTSTLPVLAPAIAPARALAVGPREAFRTIGDALGAARAGDSVIVAPGVYREQVRLEDGVSLIAAVPRAAVLAPAADASGAVVAVVAERLGSGRIAGFTIRGAPGALLDIGIRVSDAAVAIEDVEVSDARLAGVVFEGTRPASLRASRIHDNPGAGVLLRRGATARLAHNVVENNGRDPRTRSAGVELERGARADLDGNVIVGNAVAGVRGAPRRSHASLLARNVFEAGGRQNPRPLIAAPAR